MKFYFDLDRLPQDITINEAIDFFKPKAIPFRLENKVLSFTPQIKRGDEEFHEQIIYEIRKNKK